MEKSETLTKQMNLFEKIQAVSNQVRNIEKNIQVGAGNYGYKAVADLDVILAVKDAEKEFKLISIPVKQELVNSEILKTIGKDGTDKVAFIDTVKMTVRIIDIEKPADFIEVESFGKGVDSGDKGLGKASTYARKYALLNAYKIATGEDPDQEKSNDLKTLTENEKLNAISAVCFDDNARLQNILQHFSVGELKMLTSDQVNIVYNQFKAKKLIV